MNVRTGGLVTSERRENRLVHGNTLTAAVVVENVKEVLSETTATAATTDGRCSVFMTGSTSKVCRRCAGALFRSFRFCFCSSLFLGFLDRDATKERSPIRGAGGAIIAEG